MQTQKQVLLQGGVAELLCALKDTAAVNKEARKAKADVVRY